MSGEPDPNGSRTATDVAVGGLLRGDRVLLVRTRGLAAYWQPPGGKVEATDSSPRAALRRELEEELGLHLEEDAFSAFTTEPSDVGQGRVHFFVVSFRAELELEIRRSEILEYRWLQIADALELPMKPATRQFLRLLQGAGDASSQASFEGTGGQNQNRRGEA